NFNAVDVKPKADPALKFKVQVYIEDCQGCGVCIQSCPLAKREDDKKALTWTTLEKAREVGETENYKFFDDTTDNILGANKINTVKGSQLLKPLFEFSGACAGCGETPYVKLVTQLFGERMIVANATGCSSIYGGTFPTIPYCKAKNGRGPAWANSLFEDNAEFGLGMRLAIDANREQLKMNVDAIMASDKAPADMRDALAKCLELWDVATPEAFAAQDKAGAILKAAAAKAQCPYVAKAAELSDFFVDKSVWIIGGDGWAYDIGFGGLDHVIASGRNVNILVLDTEVYSNTGGQASKATQIGAVAQFAANGKRLGKKNLGIMAMSYGYVYTASISMGANRQQTILRDCLALIHGDSDAARRLLPYVTSEKGLEVRVVMAGMKAAKCSLAKDAVFQWLRTNGCEDFDLYAGYLAEVCTTNDFAALREILPVRSSNTKPPWERKMTDYHRRDIEGVMLDIHLRDLLERSLGE
ncbi:MAG TPA: thiamine pyrophosphate-dependent enzyme, partial [Lentisphaeria bacterium]|nr:thiamine pyrophosphate-dependent enzyme [Lentisphaeria bacterium]